MTQLIRNLRAENRSVLNDPTKTKTVFALHGFENLRMGRIHHRHLPRSRQPPNLPAEGRSVLNDPKKSKTVCGLHSFKTSGWAESITGIFQAAHVSISLAVSVSVESDFSCA